MLKRLLAITVTTLLAFGCGGSEPSETSAQQSTAGGETAQAEPEMAPIDRVSPPIPVPQPAMPRERLSTTLQHGWDLTEAAIAVRPPEPPMDPSEEAVRTWAAGAFADWMRARRDAVSSAENALATLGPRAPVHEKLVAAALIGYMYDDTAAGMRGAPVPIAFHHDPELLEVYKNALDEVLAPFAQQAVVAYVLCARNALDEQSGAWRDWAAYCEGRARELDAIFRLSERQEELQQQQPGSGTGTGTGTGETRSGTGTGTGTGTTRDRTH